MLIELRNLKPRYMSELEVAGSDIYLQPCVRFEQGRKYMVCARSGHGKTSLLNFIYGASREYDGTVGYGEPVVSPFALRRDRLSYLFQDLALFPELTALENVQLKNNLTLYKSQPQLEALLDQVLPSEKKHQPLRTLSLGQRQRVAAVRSLCQPFDFLLMDEPFSHLDRASAETVAAMVLREVEAQGAGLIVTALDAIDLFPFDQILKL